MFRPTKFWRPRSFSWLALFILLCAASSSVLGQDGGAPPNGGGDNGPPPMEGRRPPMERAFRLGPHGRWWNNPEFAQKLGLTADQQKRMEAVFEQSRPSLTELLTAVRKEETAMEPLLAADQPDETKVLAQIDRVAQARAQLEKTNARMLLGLRRILTSDQWKTLQAEEPLNHHSRFGPRQGPGDTPPPNP